MKVRWTKEYKRKIKRIRLYNKVKSFKPRTNIPGWDARCNWVQYRFFNGVNVLYSGVKPREATWAKKWYKIGGPFKSEYQILIFPHLGLRKYWILATFAHRELRDFNGVDTFMEGDCGPFSTLRAAIAMHTLLGL